MSIQTGDAIWNGGLTDGKGNMAAGSLAFDAPYSYKTRFEDDKKGTTPEELIGAAHAGCFSMFLSSLLENAGHAPKHIRTQSAVHLDFTTAEPVISRIEITTEAEVPDLKEADFQKFAQYAKEHCPVSKALAGVPEIKLMATLK